MCSHGFYSLSSVLTTAHTHTHTIRMSQHPIVNSQRCFLDLHFLNAEQFRSITQQDTNAECEIYFLHVFASIIKMQVGRVRGLGQTISKKHFVSKVLTIMHLFAFQTLTNLQECPQGVYAECPRGTVRVIFVSTYSQYTNLLDMEPPQLLMFRYSTFTN